MPTKRKPAKRKKTKPPMIAEREKRQREQLHREGRCSHANPLGFCAGRGFSFDPRRGWRCMEHTPASAR